MNKKTRGAGSSRGSEIKLSSEMLELFSGVKKKGTKRGKQITFTSEMDALILHPDVGWGATVQADFVRAFKKAFNFGSYHSIRNRYEELTEEGS